MPFSPDGAVAAAREEGAVATASSGGSFIFCRLFPFSIAGVGDLVLRSEAVDGERERRLAVVVVVVVVCCCEMCDLGNDVPSNCKAFIRLGFVFFGFPSPSLMVALMARCFVFAGFLSSAVIDGPSGAFLGRPRGAALRFVKKASRFADVGCCCQ